MKIPHLDIPPMIKISFILFSVILVSFLAYNLTGTLFVEPEDYSTIKAQQNITEIKVLIFAGDGSSSESVKGIINTLENYNQQEVPITSNKTIFNYTLTDEVNSTILQSQDVLIIPGGDFQIYLTNKNIDSKDIKNFVSEGHGFLGICAGAYAACNYIDSYHQGWGIAPHINSKYFNYDGNLNVTFTHYWQTTFNTTNVTTLSVANGPSMYKEDLYTPLAWYHTNTPHSGYAAILDDTRGAGRILLSSPHPERYPESGLLPEMIIWASGKK